MSLRLASCSAVRQTFKSVSASRNVRRFFRCVASDDDDDEEGINELMLVGILTLVTRSGTEFKKRVHTVHISENRTSRTTHCTPVDKTVVDPSVSRPLGARRTMATAGMRFCREWCVVHSLSLPPTSF